MALEMKTKCEKCETAVSQDDLVFICSYECTYCAACTMTLGQRCPDCGGELVRRPRRAAEAAG